MAHITQAPVSPSHDPVAGETDGNETAERTFSTSILVSAVRCVLTYVIFPFVTPLIGLSSATGASVGVVLSVIAIPANVLSIRRFHASQHRWRWYIIPLNVAIIVLVSILLVLDLRTLFG